MQCKDSHQALPPPECVSPILQLLLHICRIKALVHHTEVSNPEVVLDAKERTKTIEASEIHSLPVRFI